MIKADEWRSLITVYLPIALISLWEMGTGNSNLKLILDHTMDLVSAVHLACAWTMSSERAKEYHLSIASYVGNLKCIYLTFDLWPNHHASFHIYTYLILFGPIHSWWSFPFECLIGILQRLPNNHKSGLYSNSSSQPLLILIIVMKGNTSLQCFNHISKAQSFALGCLTHSAPPQFKNSRFYLIALMVMYL